MLILRKRLRLLSHQSLVEARQFIIIFSTQFVSLSPQFSHFFCVSHRFVLTQFVMYPRYTDLSFMAFAFTCRIIQALSAACYLIRTYDLNELLEHVTELMRNYYIEDTQGLRIDRASAVPGCSCAVVVPGGSGIVYRGEIVHVDIYDYAEVYLVDHGDSSFYDLSCLYEPPVELTMIPALLFECSLRGLDYLGDPGYVPPIVPVLYDRTLQAVPLGRGVDTPLSVQLFTLEGQDIGGLLVDQLNAADYRGYDNGGEDEGLAGAVSDPEE